MTPIDLQHMVEDIPDDRLAAWVDFDQASFSREKTLWDDSRLDNASDLSRPRFATDDLTKPAFRAPFRVSIQGEGLPSPCGAKASFTKPRIC